MPTISHSRVSSFVLAECRPPTTTMKSTARAASTVSSWRRIVTGQTVFTIFSSCARLTMNAASLSNFHGGWVDWLMSAIRFLRGIALPLLLLVHDDRVGRERRAGRRPPGAAACPAGRSCSPPRRAAASWRCSAMTHEHVPSMTSRPRAAARSRTSGFTPWARMTTAEPLSTSSSESTVRMPSACRAAMTPSLWTTWPSVCVDLAGRGRLLRLVDRLADAVAEARPSRDGHLSTLPMRPVSCHAPGRAPSGDRRPAGSASARPVSGGGGVERRDTRAGAGRRSAP